MLVFMGDDPDDQQEAPMECRIRSVKGNWYAAFKHGGVEYTQSLRTKSDHEAEVRLGAIRDTLYRLEHGTIAIPPGADPKAFILSGGQRTGKSHTAPRLTIGQMSDRYLESLQGVEDNTRLTLRIHLNHAKRVLKADTSLESVQLADVDRYARLRLSESHHGRKTQGHTVRKELRTFRRVWVWAAEHGHVACMPPWKLESITLPKDRGREPFRTFAQIDRVLKRGGMSEEDQERLWETLYLTGQELQDFLDYVRENSTAPWVYPMVAFVALTGCRRSEMVRSRIDDWDLEHGQTHIRELKRDTSREFILRDVYIHPRLREVMEQWFSQHPGGQYTISPSGEPLTVDQATDHFNRTLMGHKKWSRVRGFHTLRHSVASILASKGIDQRYIDKILGHHADAMRKRYQHLFPKGVSEAINSLLG
jgi:integrase